MNNAAITLLIFLWRELIVETLLFPIWWYSRGLRLSGQWLRGAWQWCNRLSGFSFAVRYLFTPMYGQRDFQGRVISFIFRVLTLVPRSAAFVVGSAVVLALWLVWVLGPIWALWVLGKSIFV